MIDLHIIAAMAPDAHAWRAEAEHKRWLHIETIDRVSVDLLIFLIDQVFPPATSGFVVTPVNERALVVRNPAEQDWQDVWKRHDRAPRRTSPLP